VARSLSSGPVISWGAAAVARGLWDEKNCQWLCENFMECVIPSAEWKLLAKKRALSEHVSASLEAFAVLVHKNGHAKWNEAFQLNGSDGETATSSLTSGSNGKSHFLFAGDSKGSRKHEGWNADGMSFCNNTLELIAGQRERPGCVFERELLKTLSEKPRNSHQNAGRAPRVNNNVTQPMEKIGF
jgi:hypothetical protein